MRRIPYQFIYRFFTNVLHARYSRGPNKKLVKPMVAGFYVTMKCNFRCTYCDDGSGNMYPDIAEQIRNLMFTFEDVKKIDDLSSLRTAIDKLRSEMKQAAADLEFERAAALRDKARELEQLELQMR